MSFPSPVALSLQCQARITKHFEEVCLCRYHQVSTFPCLTVSGLLQTCLRCNWWNSAHQIETSFPSCQYSPDRHQSVQLYMHENSSYLHQTRSRCLKWRLHLQVLWLDNRSFLCSHHCSAPFLSSSWSLLPASPRTCWTPSCPHWAEPSRSVLLKILHRCPMWTHKQRMTWSRHLEAASTSDS